MTPLPACEPTELDRRLDAFEAAQRETGQADLAQFLPPPAHPDYPTVLRELVRVDLEYGWSRGRPTPIDAYFARFPALAGDPEGRRSIVFEDYRQRYESGQSPDPDEYVRRYGVHPLGLDSSPAPAAEEDAPCTVAAVVAPPPAADQDGPPTNMLAAPQPLRTQAAAGPDELRLRSGELHDRPPGELPRLPEVGEVFLGFDLIGELGRGGFGRVFLARQGRLAARLVALKVSSELFYEANTLAQLQHTNIVPIFSVHQDGPLQAVCMPYFGGTTLEDVLKGLRGRTLPKSGHHFVSTLQDRRNSTRTGPSSAGKSAPASLPSALPADPIAVPTALPPSLAGGVTDALKNLDHSSWVEAVLRIGVGLAAGLAHAHERGITHRDLKPANVLLTDDGEPRLLDFNLSADNSAQGRAMAARVGGTLPYMAPEQLRAFRGGPAKAVDGRSDIYALGLILYELLTGRPAFPLHKGRGAELLDKMLADRAGPAPAVRPHNPAVTPAVEAIIRKCLAPDPSRRYQTARFLQEDVERHLEHLPLRFAPEPSRRERVAKWARRHPRLTSASGVTAIAAAVLVAVGAAAFAWHERAANLEAYQRWTDFAAAVDGNVPGLVHAPDAKADRPEAKAAFLATARAPVATYRVAEDPRWQTAPTVTRLAADRRADLRERMGEYLLLVAQALLDQPDAGEDRLREALVYNDRAGDLYATDARPRLWTGQRKDLLNRLGRTAEADALGEPTGLDPRSAQDHYLAALDGYRRGRVADAAAALREAVRIDPRHFRARFLLGNCYFQQQENAKAADCYSACIALNPGHAKVRFNHGTALFRAGHFGPAYEEFKRAADLDPDLAQARIEEASAALKLGRHTEAAELLTAVLAAPAAPTVAYYYRAQARDKLGDKAGAAADRAALLDREPADELSCVLRGLTRMRSAPQAALADFQKAEELNPRSFHALQNQAHVLSEYLKRDADCLPILDRLIDLYPQNHQARAGRAVVLARLGRTEDALRDAKVCLDTQPAPPVRYQLAGVYARTADRPGHAAEALRLVAGALRDGAGWDDLSADPDLDPVRANPEFRRLQEAVRTVQQLGR